jgi:hypothetical protein
LRLPPRHYPAVHPRREIRTPSLQEETPRTESLQLTSFQVHPWQHPISGWRLSPRIANPLVECLGWWVATVCSRHANQPPHPRFRRLRPGWQRGWCRVGQPSSNHPPFRSPSVLGLPLSGLFGHLWDGCHDDRRLFLTSNTASGIPVRVIEARNAPHPVSPTSGTRRPEAPYHRQVPSCAQWACALDRTIEPPLLPGFATEATASGRRSRLYPRAARLPRAPVVHRASSATHRLSASAT